MARKMWRGACTAACVLWVTAVPRDPEVVDGCTQPLGQQRWACDRDSVDETWSSPNDAWNLTVDGWAGTAPCAGTFNASRVTRSKQGDLVLEVKDNGNGNGCGCDCEPRFSTAVVASKAKFGDGYYEAKLKTPGTDYQAEFWLQSMGGEINVVAMNPTHQREYQANFHCFTPDTKEGAASHGNATTYTAAATADTFVTYGLLLNNGLMSFYENGEKVGTLEASCVKGGDMHVVFSHDINPFIGGYNDNLNWHTAPYDQANPGPKRMVVEYFRYWKSTLDTYTATINFAAMNSAARRQALSNYEAQFAAAGCATDTTTELCAAIKKQMEAIAVVEGEAAKTAAAGVDKFSAGAAAGSQTANGTAAVANGTTAVAGTATAATPNPDATTTSSAAGGIDASTSDTLPASAVVGLAAAGVFLVAATGIVAVKYNKGASSGKGAEAGHASSHSRRGSQHSQRSSHFYPESGGVGATAF